MDENNETDELYELFECADRKEFAKEIANVISDEFSKIFKERVLPHLRRDTEGRLWYVDDDERPVAELVGGLLSKKKETSDDRAVIKEASQLSLQKKEERLVINLPAWLKDRLKKRANRTNKSMNEIIRIALSEYLSK
jgi:hypothetical protein